MVAEKPKDPTAGKRMAAQKDRLQEAGGKRFPVNLDGKHVRKLDRLVKHGFGKNHSDVIRNLIEDAKCS